MKPGKSIIAFLLFTTLAWAGIAPAYAADSIRAVVQKILDPTTVQIQTKKKTQAITLAGIGRTNRQAWPYLEKTILNQRVRLIPTGQGEGYIIREKDDLLVNEQLIRNGYATYQKTNNDPFHSRMQKAQHIAKEAEIGIWNQGTKPKTHAKTQSIQNRAPPGKDIVYITRTGKKYHRGTCRYLKQSKIPIERKEAEKYYTPCKVCRP